MELFRSNIAPWWQYVPSKLNVYDIWSRPDKVDEERWFVKRCEWKKVDPRAHFDPLARLLKTRPEVAWGALSQRLYSGRQ